MDDYSVTSLYESKNEWASRLVNILTPLIQEGFRSIFDESVKLCVGNKEQDKYLMTFQNLLTRVPKWNPNIIKEETSRIKERSTCGYLEDLIKLNLDMCFDFRISYPLTKKYSKDTLKYSLDIEGNLLHLNHYDSEVKFDENKFYHTAYHYQRKNRYWRCQFSELQMKPLS